MSVRAKTKASQMRVKVVMEILRESTGAAAKASA
jgi:hypothetical protein